MEAVSDAVSGSLDRVEGERKRIADAPARLARWPIRRLAQRPRRRRFTAEYKLAIVREAHACMHQAGRGRCAAAPVSALLEELLSKGATQTGEQQPPR